MSSHARLLVVDTHPVVRAGYASILNPELDLQVHWEADSGDHALHQILDETPDLVLTDLMLEGLNGIEFVKQISAHAADVPILVITGMDQRVYAERALRAGARGYLDKRASPGEIRKAVRALLEDNIYVSDALRQYMVGRALRGDGGNGDAATTPTGELSDRELEVFAELGSGLTTREIAEQLNISPKTVETHRSRIKEKLSIDSNSSLIRFAALWLHDQQKPNVG